MLEVVEIDDQQRRRLVVARDVVPHPLELLFEPAPVEEPRQHVVVGQVLQLALVALLLGDVLEVADAVERTTVARAHQVRVDLNPDRVAVRVEIPFLDEELGGLAARDAIHRAGVDRTVVRVGERHERTGHQLLGRVSREPAEGRVDLHEAPQVSSLHRDERQPDRRLLECDAEANLGLLELCPGALRLGARCLRLAIQAGVLEGRRCTVAELAEQLQLHRDQRVVEAHADDADRSPADYQWKDRERHDSTRAREIASRVRDSQIAEPGVIEGGRKVGIHRVEHLPHHGGWVAGRSVPLVPDRALDGGIIVDHRKSLELAVRTQHVDSASAAEARDHDAGKRLCGRPDVQRGDKPQSCLAQQCHLPCSARALQIHVSPPGPHIEPLRTMRDAIT